MKCEEVERDCYLVFRELKIPKRSGGDGGMVTPVPISNTVVKLLSADDTWREAAWESRTLPVNNMRKWLRVRASPCQGEGREFESRFAL